MTYQILIFLMLIFQRETEHQQGRGRERGGDTESEAGSRLRAVSIEPDAELKRMGHKIMTWAKAGRLTDWATQAPDSPRFTKVFIEFYKMYLFMGMDINQTYCGDQLTTYTNIEPLRCTPETNIMLYVSCTSMKKKMF